MKKMRVALTKNNTKYLVALGTVEIVNELQLVDANRIWTHDVVQYEFEENIHMVIWFDRALLNILLFQRIALILFATLACVSDECVSYTKIWCITIIVMMPLMWSCTWFACCWWQSDLNPWSSTLRIRRTFLTPVGFDHDSKTSLRSSAGALSTAPRLRLYDKRLSDIINFNFNFCDSATSVIA